MTPMNYDLNDTKRGEGPDDIPPDHRAWEARQQERARRNNVGTGGISKAKALIATGAVAGALGGWPLFAQQGAATSTQSATPSSTLAALALTSTATSTPQASSTPATQSIVTSLPSTATPTLQPSATATTAASTSTPSPTAVPQATATLVPAVQAPVTNTRSSR